MLNSALSSDFMVTALRVWNKTANRCDVQCRHTASCGSKAYSHVTYLSVDYHTRSHFLGMVPRFPLSVLIRGVLLSTCRYLAVSGQEQGFGDMRVKGLEIKLALSQDVRHI